MSNANLIVKHHLHREVLNKRNRFKKKQGSIELSDDHDLGTVKIIRLIDGVDARGQVRDINIFIKDQKRQRHIGISPRTIGSSPWIMTTMSIHLPVEASLLPTTSATWSDAR